MAASTVFFSPPTLCRRDFFLFFLRVESGPVLSEGVGPLPLMSRFSLFPSSGPSFAFFQVGLIPSGLSGLFPSFFFS